MNKHGYSLYSKPIEVEADKLTSYVSGDVLQKLDKYASHVKSIAPKSDDFLYFSIIFMKAAEASVIDENGEPLIVNGSERAWGYFDENWRWKGNVKPHSNRNRDIFPELHLKQAYQKWIGMPLCIDHQSDTVDGVRGIILDTHYDEKRKQVVGLCALDKINYPDLARKVQTGVIRYGSMGTAVGISVCTDCGNMAKTASEFCVHVKDRTCYGEVNLELKPIEYSLVVQPAEPGAILLKCIASIQEHKQVLSESGISNFDDFADKLNIRQAKELEKILSVACDGDSCSISERQKIIRSYLNKENLIKNADMGVELDFAKAIAQIKEATGRTVQEAPDAYKDIYEAFGKQIPTDFVAETSVTSNQTVDSDPSNPTTIVGPKDSEDVADYTGVAGNTSMFAGETEPSDSFGSTGGVGPETYAFANESIREIKKITEEIMNEARIRKRATQRRTAFHNGGSDGVEPNTFKSEDYKKYWNDDTHMTPSPKSLGGTDGMAPGDKEVKEKQSRAYHNGGADGVEPKTFKSEDYKKYWNQDTHMTPSPKSLGGTDGMVPGDKEVKEKQSRAAYTGAPLRTKLSIAKNADGTINKAASIFRVYAGEKEVIRSTAGKIWGRELNREWDFMRSQEYGKTVVATIREKGLGYVKSQLMRTAQQAPAMEAPAAPQGPAVPPDMDAGMEPLDMPPLDEMDNSVDVQSDIEDPSRAVSDAFTAIEEAVSAGRDAAAELEGSGVDVNVNVGEGDSPASDKISLSRDVLRNLKVAIAEADESADELALLSETYDHARNLSASQLRELKGLAKEAMQDAAELVGQTKALIRVSNTIKNSLRKTAEKSKEEIVKEALDLRKERRNGWLKQAEDSSMMSGSSLADKITSSPSGVSNSASDKKEDKEDECPVTEALKKMMACAKDEDFDGVTDLMDKLADALDECEESTESESDENESCDAKTGGRTLSGANKSKVGKMRAALNPAEDAKAEPAKAENEAKDVKTEEKEEPKEEVHTAAVKSKLSESLVAKKASEDRETYRIRMRRAYDVGLEMQRKGMIGGTKHALDQQVDELLQFDDRSFESFKRSVSMFNAPSLNKSASDLGGINVGITNDSAKQPAQEPMQDRLKKLWGK
jgi:hypothetical protein